MRFAETTEVIHWCKHPVLKSLKFHFVIACSIVFLCVKATFIFLAKPVIFFSGIIILSGERYLFVFKYSTGSWKSKKLALNSL